MADILVFAAFLSFLLFLVTGWHQNHAAMLGWFCIVLNLWSDLPAFLHEGNFLYPFLALLSLPFLLVTFERLRYEDPAVIRLSRSVAIAILIWGPFALVSPLGNGLISIVISLVLPVITAFGHQPQLFAWDVIAENGFYNQIILGCTGILAMAMMLGIVLGERDITPVQVLVTFLIIVPGLFILNLLRVAVVFIAVSDHWFAGFPDPTGTGDPNFFWAHNVIAEGLALLLLFLLTGWFARLIPALGTSAEEVVRTYRNALLTLVGQVSENTTL